MQYALYLTDNSDPHAGSNGILSAINFNFSSHGDRVVDLNFTVGGICLLRESSFVHPLPDSSLVDVMAVVWM